MSSFSFFHQMKNRIAVFMCNLKPVKMREIFSEGMIMCASSAEKTEILVPPPDAEIGDHVIFEDYPGKSCLCLFFLFFFSFQILIIDNEVNDPREWTMEFDPN